METKRIALLGQPNCGKSTIFNILTGMHQHVGNWPGKTVEKKDGSFKKGDICYEITDLPGSYSLSANSEEEIITRNYIVKNDLDLVCILADGSQLERSLYMLADFAGIKTPAMLVLTMMDVAEEQEKEINIKKISDKLGIPVTGITAPDPKDYEKFFDALEEAVKNLKSLNDSVLYEMYKNGEEKDIWFKAEKAAESLSSERRTSGWIAGKILEQDTAVLNEAAITSGGEEIKNISAKCSEELLKESVVKKKQPAELLSRFDKIALSRRWGKPLAVGVLLIALIASMVIAMPFMLFGKSLPSIINGSLTSALTSAGVSAGIIHFFESTFVTAFGWVISMLGFVFAINLVFGFIEEAGYMARVSYAFDSTMAKLGLQGKAIMPILTGFGCTIGGAASTRVMDTWGQRILTMAVVWAVPCGATFAVIPTLASTFFGWGGILVMILIFAIMFVHIFITAKIFGRKLSPKEERAGLIMELPPYHKARWKFLIKQSGMRVWEIFKKAFSMELIVCIIFYFLTYSSSGIEGSVLYKFGILIEPVTKFIGMGWQTFMAFIASMVSKEAVLGVLSAIFANSGSIFDSTSGAAAAAGNAAELAGAFIPKAEALAFMIAVTFNIPCLQAVVSTFQESHSLKWTLKIAAYYLGTTLVLSCIVYHIALLFF